MAPIHTDMNSSTLNATVDGTMVAWESFQTPTTTSGMQMVTPTTHQMPNIALSQALTTIPYTQDPTSNSTQAAQLQLN